MTSVDVVVAEVDESLEMFIVESLIVIVVSRDTARDGGGGGGGRVGDVEEVDVSGVGG